MTPSEETQSVVFYRIMKFRVLALIAIAAPAWGQSGDPRMACSDLRSLTGYEFSVATAVVIAAAGDVPEYCRVTGNILPEVRFEVSLPKTWNRKLHMSG